MMEKGKSVRSISLPGGLSVGIQGLDEAIAEVSILGIADPEEIGRELLRRLEDDNFIAPGAENLYATAFVRAYNRMTGTGVSHPEVEPKKKNPG